MLRAFCYLNNSIVGLAMTQLTNMYDTSPDSYVYGAVYRLLLMSTALSYCEYKVKTEVAFLTQVFMFVTNAACFFAKKMRRCKKYRPL